MATAREVIGTLQNRGVTLEADVAGGLRVIGISRLSDREKSALKAHKGAILKALAVKPSQPAATTTAPIAVSTAVTEALSNRIEASAPDSTQPFGQRELDAIKAGSGCWVWSGVLEAWLFWVRDEERRAKAIVKGIEPGCIWTLPELTGVVGMPPEGLRDIATIKRQFTGAIVPGEVPARWRNATSLLKPAVTTRLEGRQ